MRHVIEDPADPRLECYRALRDGAELKARGLLIAEGRRAVRALLASPFAIESLLLTPRAESELDLADDVPRYIVERDLLYELVRFKLHQGALACATRGTRYDWRTLVGRLLVFDAVSDPDNIGTTFRNAAAFGVGGVLLGPHCADPLYRKAIRTSSGTTLTLPYAETDDLPAALAAMERQRIALVPDGEIALSELTLEPDCALILGNEGEGVSPEVRAQATCVRIAMQQGADSVNVAAAGAIALHHAFTSAGADPRA